MGPASQIDIGVAVIIVQPIIPDKIHDYIVGSGISRITYSCTHGKIGGPHIDIVAIEPHHIPCERHDAQAGGCVGYELWLECNSCQQ
jgi:hypothetical protein